MDDFGIDDGVHADVVCQAYPIKSIASRPVHVQKESSLRPTNVRGLVTSESLSRAT